MPQEVFQQRVKNVHSQWQFSTERDLKNYGNDAKYEFLHTQDTFFLTQATTGEGKVGRLTVHISKNSTSNFSSMGET